MKKIINFSNGGSTLIIIIIFLFAIDLSAQTGDANTLPQFLFPKFSKSIVKMKDGNIYTAFINYNMVDEEVIFEQKGKYMALDKPELIDTVFIQNKPFIPFEKSFYEVLVKGPLSFYIQHKCKFVPVGSTTAYGMTSQTLGTTAVRTMQVGNQVRSLDVPENVTISMASVNWVKKNNEMEKFTNERQFLKIFSEKETQLKEYIKKEKLDLKIREDLIKLGNYCNDLVK
jgi:hypothetical protein